MREYELNIIIQPEISEEGSATILSRLYELLEAGSSIRLLCDDLGKRKLAYEVNRFQKGHYYLLSFLDPGPVVAELERVLRLEESVLRFLTVKVNDDVTDIEGRVAEAKEREEELEKRAAERPREKPKRPRLAPRPRLLPPSVRPRRPSRQKRRRKRKQRRARQQGRPLRLSPSPPPLKPRPKTLLWLRLRRQWPTRQPVPMRLLRPGSQRRKRTEARRNNHERIR